MTRAQILTPWLGTGAHDDPFRPALAADYPMAWVDVTGQLVPNLIPVPNALVVEAVMEDAVFAQVQADPGYADVVLWSEPV